MTACQLAHEFHLFASYSFICSTACEIKYQLVQEPAVPAYLDAGGRRLDPDPPELSHCHHEIAEEGTLIKRAVVDRAVRPHVGLEQLVGAHQEGVDEAVVHGP